MPVDDTVAIAAFDVAHVACIVTFCPEPATSAFAVNCAA
jgi:hypothetical protein